MRFATFDASTPPPAPSDWDEVKEKTLTYLENGKIVTIALEPGEDHLEPGTVDVPIGFRTDGMWAWSMELPYYVAKYAMPIDAGLLAHIRERGFVLPEVEPRAADQAWTELLRLHGIEEEPS